MKFSMFSVMDHYPTELPRTEAQFVGEWLEQTVVGEQLGYEASWVAEHHFSNYGLAANPAVLLAAAAARTTKIRLGPAVIVLPLRNAINAAEDYTLLDLLSNGRLNLAVGSGYLEHEFDPLGIPLAEKVERFNEALDLFKTYLSNTKTTFAGKWNQVTNLTAAAPMVQRPYPPIHIAVLRKEAAYYVGRKGHNILGIAYVTLQRPEDWKEVADAFKRGYAESGAPQELIDIPMALKVHVAETREQAIAECREAGERYLRTRKYGKDVTFEQLIEQKLIAVGDPDDVAKVFAEYQAAGVTNMFCLQNFGGLPHNLVLKSMGLLAKQVAPRFQKAAVI